MMTKLKAWTPLTLAAAAALPWIVLRLSGFHGDPYLVTFLAGMSIVAASFILSWAAEVSQMDIPQNLALLFLALVAVLPEYAVDLYFAWTAGQNPAYSSYAIANMTGANRLLIGLGWAVVVLIIWATRRQHEVELKPENAIEVSWLAIATVYALFITFRSEVGWFLGFNWRNELNLFDAAVYLLCFLGYVRAVSRLEVEEPELAGTAARLAALAEIPRRTIVVILFLFAAGAILAAAEPFAEGLVQSGRLLGIDEFLLVQWLAPLASESPEIIVAVLFALKGNPTAALGALLSSKVNQWTLLVGALPIAYSISFAYHGSTGPSPFALVLDDRQGEELLLTAAQSMFAVAVLANLRLSVLEATGLLVLFATQLFFTQEWVRYGYSALYLVLTLGIFVRHRDRLPMLVSQLPWPGKRITRSESTPAP